MVNEHIQDPERQAILDAATRLFERFGYKKTTVEDIAQEANIGKGTVYLRFSSKEEIGLAWLKNLHQDLHRDLTPIDHATPAENLRNILVMRVMLRYDIFEKHRQSLDDVLCSLREQVEERKKVFHEVEAGILSKLIKQGIEQGLFDSPDPDQDARSMIVATNSLMPYRARTEQLGTRDSVQTQTELLADLLVRGIEVNHG